ncbi:MAG: bifunctional biotin--[acetyl-CoA-carboxylase] ligase/biotin operon repressor BirA [Gammaproteobacteria bacterium]
MNSSEATKPVAYGLPEKQKKLLTLLADGAFHSGAILAETLGVSRAAVWKYLAALAELGLEHIAISGKGYRLERPLELLRQRTIEAELTAEARSELADFEIFDRLVSTNTYLVERSHAGARSGCVCMAEFQSGGRGRQGRTWVSPFGSNIYLSVLCRFCNGPSVLSGLSLAVGVAVVRALSQLGVDGIGLKWPNDIYWQGRKLGGILVEISGEANGPCAVVVGLGLNVYLPASQAESITQAWTDLRQVTGWHKIPRNRLAAALLNQLLPVISGFEATTFAAYIDEWRRYDCLKDRAVGVFLFDRRIDGIACGIDEQGLFVLQTGDGEKRVFASGEISFSGPWP